MADHSSDSKLDVQMDSVAHQQHGASGAPVKKRNRKAVSCVSCREKKIKCDRVVPCNQCSKRGEQHLCRIEQKAKNDSARHAETAASLQAPQSALSPGSLAYSQFSAAIASARSQVDSAQSSVSPPPAEVDDIKLRLAQVEALLAGQIPLSSASSFSSASATSPANWNSYRGNISSVTAASQYSSSSYSPNSIFTAHRSTPQTQTSQQHSMSPLGIAIDTDDSSEEADEDEQEHVSAPSASPLDSRRTSPVNYLDTSCMPVSRKEMDTDTEDAAIVLERLAMNTESEDRWARDPCPQLGDQNKTKSSDATGLEKCLGGDALIDYVSVKNEGNAHHHSSTLSSADDGATERPRSARTTNVPMTSQQPRANGSHGPGGGVPGLLLPPLTSQTGSDGQTNDGDFPMCACRSASDTTQQDDSSAIPNDQAGLLACLVKHQPLSTEPAPIAVPCRLACENTGLLRLKSGPDTLFGWGMGWAWSAADVLMQKEQLKAHEENRPFVVDQRTEREAVCRAICESLPSKEIALQLIEVYETRVRYLSGHIVHIPCLKREVEAFYALDSVEKRARVVDRVDPGWLAMLLGVLALGLRFYPCSPKAGWKPANHLFDGKTVHAWYSAAKTCLVLAGFLKATSLSTLQAILLLYLFNSVSGSKCGSDSDTGTTYSALIRIAITNAQEMGLHRLGDLDKQPRPKEPSSKVIRREIAKRIWWALVNRDWNAAGSGCSKDYIIRAENFNTPFPGNYNDDDLMRTPLPPPRPREEFTEMSYVLCNLEYSVVVKDDADVRLRRELHEATNGGDRRLTCSEARKLDVAYRAVLENAPSFFKVGSEIGRVTCIEVQRWLLQQAVFSKLLRLHRPNLSSRKESRTNCVLLARSILDMQKKIRSRCTVIDRLWVNLMQSFSAAIVLALHLLHTRQTLEHRVSVRSEINEAIRALKQVDGNDCAAKKCIRVIEALLAEEEERWQAGNEALSQSSDASLTAADLAKHKRKRQADTTAIDDIEAGNGSGRRKNLHSLAQRVALAAQDNASQQTSNATQLQPEEKSKRQATRSAVQGADQALDPTSLIAQMQNSNQMPLSGFSFNGVSAVKDNASRLRMDAMTLPTFASASTARTDDVPFPEMMPSAVHHNAAFDFGNSTFQEGNGRMVAPNGVDLLMTSPMAPTDDQAFDLAAFLEQCDSSPSSSGDDSLLTPNEEHNASTASEYSAHDSRKSGVPAGGSRSVSGDITDATSVSSFGEGSLTQEAIQKQQQQLKRGQPLSSTQTSSPTEATTVDPSTDMDTFWNCIITQGANVINAVPDSAASAPINAGVQTKNGTASQGTGQGRFFGANESSALAQKVPNMNNFGNLSLPSYPPVSSKAVMPSVGTPSAGFGLESYLATPLYDFTDFANAWTASNPNAPIAMPGTSHGPISDA